MDILTILLGIIFVGLFPLGQVFRVNLGNSVAANPLDIGVCIISLISIVVVIVKHKKLPNVFLPMGVFVIAGLISLFFDLFHLSQNEFIVSLLYLIRFSLYIGIGIAVWVLPKKQKSHIQNILLIAGGIIVLAGYIQYFFYPSLRQLLYEGWDPHLYRMFTTFLDPNFAGIFFVLYFLFVFHLLLQQKSVQQKIILGVLCLLSFFAVILSLSRGAYVVLGISFLTYLFLKGYRKIALGIPLLVLALGVMISVLTPYGEGKNLLRTASTDARLISDMNALQIFLKNPILGVGFDSYRYAQYRYHLLSGLQWQETHSGAGTNNSYLFVLATTGLFGGIVYGYFWFHILHSSYLSLKKKENALLFFVTWIALLVSGIFENTLFYPSIMLWMWAMMGLYLA